MASVTIKTSPKKIKLSTHRFITEMKKDGTKSRVLTSQDILDVTKSVSPSPSLSEDENYKTLDQ
jgi:hypothetical protein